ncbi:MAG: hypothetical protein JWP57_4513 [Spirosoma sp.]|nr:hypothetical protein [Spirosoma sp.]
MSHDNMHAGAARIARAVHRGDKQEEADARRALAQFKIEAAIDKALASAPALTSEQVESLAAQLRKDQPARQPAVDSARPKTWPVAQQSALRAAVRAAVIADPSQTYGYAVLSSGEIAVAFFPDAASLRRAMAALYTRNGKWQYPLSWENVLFFEPEEPLRFIVTIEEDDKFEAEQ